MCARSPKVCSLFWWLLQRGHLFWSLLSNFKTFSVFVSGICCAWGSAWATWISRVHVYWLGHNLWACRAYWGPFRVNHSDPHFNHAKWWLVLLLISYVLEQSNCYRILWIKKCFLLLRYLYRYKWIQLTVSPSTSWVRKLTYCAFYCFRYYASYSRSYRLYHRRSNICGSAATK